MRVQIEKKIEERKILVPDLRERRRQRVREEGNRREGARREMRHTVPEGQVEGNRFSVEAGAVRASGSEKEREEEQR